MQIRRYRDGDIEKIDLQDEQKHEFCSVGYPADTSFTVENNGAVLGVFGFVEIYKGRGAVFSFISKHASKEMLPLVRKLKAMIDEGMAKTGLERLEMSVLEGFEHGDRFAKMLGFEFEGVMRKYYKGRNYKLYARVK